MPKLNVTQASITSLFIYLIGQLVAFIPALSPEKQSLISTGSLVIAGVFALVHGVESAVSLVREYLASKNKVTLADLESGIRSFAQDEISKVNLTGDVEKLLDDRHLPTLADLTTAVQTEIRKLLGSGETPPPPVTAAPPVVVEPIPPVAPQV